MTCHEAFLCALVADPLDITMRLVFADWLEEQGNPWSQWQRETAELMQRVCLPDDRPWVDGGSTDATWEGLEHLLGISMGYEGLRTGVQFTRDGLNWLAENTPVVIEPGFFARPAD